MQSAIRTLAVFLLAAHFQLSTGLAYASEELKVNSPPKVARELFSQDDTRVLDPAEAYLRTQALLKHFGVPAEDDSQPAASMLDGNQSLKTFNLRLNYFDRKNAFPKFFKSDSSALQVFQDASSRSVGDFTVRFAGAKIPDLRNKLGWKGLRVALDPGHMGGKLWDERTGKFVKDKGGRVLSEGVMALQVAKLLEQRLTKLGAEVLLTRQTLEPVSKLDYDTFSLQPWARKELRETTLLPWFQQLLSAGPVGSALFNAFDQSQERQVVFSEAMRWKYFVLRADLEARAELIRAFVPDLTLVIHFDTNDPPGDPTGIATHSYDAVKTYVQGGFEANELASRTDRLQLVQHALSSRAWTASVKLSRGIAKQIHEHLGVAIEENDFGNSQKVESGVFARNLAVSRMIPGIVTSYVECLYYNDPNEFELFQNQPHPMDIGGQNYPYSDRLLGVVDALEAALKDFVGAP